jgi:hypothetical protein
VPISARCRRAELQKEPLVGHKKSELTFRLTEDPYPKLSSSRQ